MKFCQIEKPKLDRKKFAHLQSHGIFAIGSSPSSVGTWGVVTPFTPSGYTYSTDAFAFLYWEVILKINCGVLALLRHVPVTSFWGRVSKYAEHSLSSISLYALKWLQSISSCKGLSTSQHWLWKLMHLRVPHFNWIRYLKNTVSQFKHWQNVGVLSDGIYIFQNTWWFLCHQYSIIHGKPSPTPLS